jgi:ABC-type Fe3+ transport system permease subunit
VTPGPARQRPTRPRLALVVAVGAAAIALVVVLTVGLLRDGVGTGDPLDPWRAVGRVLTDPAAWRIVGLSAVLGAAVTSLVGLLGRGR